MKTINDLKEMFTHLNDSGEMPIPRMIMLETRSRCNGLCSFCPANALVDNRGDTLMEEDLFTKIINDLAEMDYPNRLSLYNNNEPFLDKRIFKFISQARESLPKAYIELKSNGTVVTKEKVLKAFNSGLDMLYINDYNDIPKHNTSVIKLKEDLSGIRRFGVNGLNNNDFHRIEITLRDRGAIMGSRGGKSPNKTDPVNPYKNAMCLRPCEMMTISPSGQVSICCEDFDWSLAFLNVKDRSLSDIWSSNEWSEIRKKLLNGEREWHKSCESCDMHGYSLEMLSEYNIKRNQLDPKLIIRRIYQKITKGLNVMKFKIKAKVSSKSKKEIRKEELALIAAARKKSALLAQSKKS